MYIDSTFAPTTEESGLARAVRRIIPILSKSRTGNCAVILCGARFDRIDYVTASALYEAARGAGDRSCSLIDDYAQEIVRSSWHRNTRRRIPS